MSSAADAPRRRGGPRGARRRVAEDLKDPRVGFVTVTDVETSPDLRHARCSSASRRRDERAPRRLDGLRVGPRRPAARIAQRAAPEAHARRWTSPRRHAPSAADAPRGGSSTTLAGRAREAATEASGTVEATRAAGPRRAARASSGSCSSRTSTPTATRSARSWRCTRVLRALGKDSVMFMAADEFPLPYEYRFFDLDGLSVRAAAATSTSARSSSWTAATSTATRSRWSSARRRTSSTSTTTTTTRASARSTTSSRTPRAPPRSSGT